jgi:nucleotide-binding universal stress UspA family protein
MANLRPNRSVSNWQLTISNEQQKYFYSLKYITHKIKCSLLIAHCSLLIAKLHCMFRKILVALDHTTADESLLPQVAELAELCGAGLLLVHVADGWATQWQNELNLTDSEEVHRDTRYLLKRVDELTARGIATEHCLARGNPAQEILQIAEEHHCDLIAMTSHGHRFIADVWLGSTIDKVRHLSNIPLLLVRAKDAPKNIP